MRVKGLLTHVPVLTFNDQTKPVFDSADVNSYELGNLSGLWACENFTKLKTDKDNSWTLAGKIKETDYDTQSYVVEIPKGEYRRKKTLSLLHMLNYLFTTPNCQSFRLVPTRNLS